MVTIVCSRYETFGTTLVEAMSLGCPVVAADVGGISEIIQHERNGLLCRQTTRRTWWRRPLRSFAIPSSQRASERRRLSIPRHAITRTRSPGQTLAFYRRVIGASSLFGREGRVSLLPHAKAAVWGGGLKPE